MPDRLLHHSTVVSIQGEDYRLKDKRRAGLREYPFQPDEISVPLTIVAMLAASWIAGLLWNSVFSFPLPSFIAGIIGGLTALPYWELLKRIRPREARNLG